MAPALADADAQGEAEEGGGKEPEVLTHSAPVTGEIGIEEASDGTEKV
jgi:hypothetical protein